MAATVSATNATEPTNIFQSRLREIANPVGFDKLEDASESAATASSGLAKRSAGCRARQRRIVASQRASRSGKWIRGDGAGSWSRLTAVLIGVSATNGRVPVTISKRTTPSAYESVAGVDRAALDLLRRHVGGRARNLAVVVKRNGETRSVVAPSLRLARPKSVTTARTSPPGDGRLHEHDVEALEVAMHDAGPVRGGEGGRHLPREGEASAVESRPSRRSRSARVSPCRSSMARTMTSDGSPAAPGRGRRPVAVHVEDPAHVRMGHLPGQVDLALEHRHRSARPGRSWTGSS